MSARIIINQTMIQTIQITLLRFCPFSTSEYFGRFFFLFHFHYYYLFRLIPYHKIQNTQYKCMDIVFIIFSALKKSVFENIQLCSHLSANSAYSSFSRSVSTINSLAGVVQYLFVRQWNGTHEKQNQI